MDLTQSLGDETFDISVDSATPLWLSINIYARTLVGNDDLVGRGYTFLNPTYFADLLTHDHLMDLDTKDTEGKILLRISMEGEKDEIGFYFGRAFRSLNRAESDMVRIFVDKVGAVY